MVLFPKGGLGRLLVGVIIITTISYLVLNLVSFGGNRWISYTDVPVRFGLWTVCDTTTSGLCNYWTQSFASNRTDNTFNGSKPRFVRTAQGLEIVSLILYVFAALFIIVGFINLPEFPYKISFAIAAALLFLCIIFLSASLGVMSTQGRENHPGAFLDWAWWNGLVGLIMTIVCFFSLIFLLIYMETSLKSKQDPSQLQRSGSINNSQQNIYGLSPPLAPLAPPPVRPLASYPLMNSFSQPNSFNEYFEGRQMNYVGQHPMINQNPYGVYQTSPSPLVTEIFREYLNQKADQQYETELLEPYEQYLRNSYSMNYYL